MTTVSETPPALPARVARQCKAFVDQSGTKGKARDKLTLSFWAGAAMSLHETGDKENAAWIYRIASLLIATRGYSENERLAQ